MNSSGTESIQSIAFSVIIFKNILVKISFISVKILAFFIQQKQTLKCVLYETTYIDLNLQALSLYDVSDQIFEIRLHMHFIVFKNYFYIFALHAYNNLNE